MGLLTELATRDCERYTSRLGCLGNAYSEDRCDPCAARAELGIKQSVRKCERCGSALAEAITWDGDKALGTGLDGSDHCPSPRHSPHLYYDEFTKRGKGA